MRESAKPNLKAVTVEGWGKVHIAVLTVGQMDELRAEGDSQSLAKNFARFLRNADGTPVFDLNDPEQVAVANNQPYDKVSVLLKAINSLNAITLEASDEVKKR